MLLKCVFFGCGRGQCHRTLVVPANCTHTPPLVLGIPCTTWYHSRDGWATAKRHFLPRVDEKEASQPMAIWCEAVFSPSKGPVPSAGPEGGVWWTGSAPGTGRRRTSAASTRTSSRPGMLATPPRRRCPVACRAGRCHELRGSQWIQGWFGGAGGLF